MNTSKEEFLSAFLDDEAGEFERRRLMDELKKDQELGNTLSRYALMGEAMRAGKGQRMGSGASLLSRIQAELEAEPAYEQSNVVQMPVRTESRSVRSYRWVGVGIAATVAAVALGGLLFTQQPAQQVQTAAALPVAPVAQASGKTMLAETAPVDERIQQVGQINPQTRDILKQYVAQHVKYASSTVIAPSIRAVSYANER